MKKQINTQENKQNFQKRVYSHQQQQKDKDKDKRALNKKEQLVVKIKGDNDKIN